MTRVAAVDIGTNSVRLLVADLEGEGADATLTPVDRRMRITRLGRNVHDTRRLAPEALDRTLAVLHEYAAAIEAHGAPAARIAATSAARDATNRDELFDAVASVLGAPPELLSGEEEAALSFRGAVAQLDGAGPYLVVDVGGGSTELVLGTTTPEGLVSIDVGSVRLTEQYLHTDPPAPEELSVAVSVVRDHLADVERELPGARRARTLVGVAGTITTMAAIELGVAEHDRERLHHFVLTHDAAEDVFRTLATEPLAQRRHNPGLDPDRADVIVGGAIVVVSVMRHYGFAEMLVSEADILDGLARTAVTAG